MIPEKIAATFRLIRPVNLSFIALTMLLTRFFLLNPVLEVFEKTPTLSLPFFILLVFATLCIAAAGYIINDYFDIKTDAINKPRRVLVQNALSRREAMSVHLGLNIAGVFLSAIVGLKAGNIQLAFIFAFCAGLLWFYSTTFKRMFLVGNLVVSLLTALVVVIVVMFEPAFYSLSDPEFFQAARWTLVSVLGYTFFAFYVSVLRELLKDIEDVRGDEQLFCRTIPIVLGIPVAKMLSALLMAGFIGILSFLQARYAAGREWFPIFYIAVFIQAPMAYAVFLLQKADLQNDFGRISTIIKMVMFFGILSMAVFYGFKNLFLS